MLRGNLSSRPFYNERLVTMAIVAVGVLVVAMSAFNASELVALSRQRSEFASQATRDEALAARIDTEAATLTKMVDKGALQLLAGATREANDKIDQRTFSWTTFFGLLEQAMPMDVRLVAVSPKAEKGEIKVTMQVVAKQGVDLNAFIKALNNTGHFYDVTAKGYEQNAEGDAYNAVIEAYYYVAPTPEGAAIKTKTKKGRS